MTEADKIKQRKATGLRFDTELINELKILAIKQDKMSCEDLANRELWSYVESEKEKERMASERIKEKAKKTKLKDIN